VKNRTQLAQLREFIAETVRSHKKRLDFGHTRPQHLLDDPSFQEKSVYVPDDIKEKIKKWAKAMLLWDDKP